MSEPGTPLPWATENDGRVIVNANGDMIVGDHGMTQNVAAYIVEACNNFPEAIKLLRDCYIAGHRNGWEDGPTNQEVFNRVAMFMHFHDSEWWKQQQWESEGE